MPRCKIDGCHKPAEHLEMCYMHYERMRKKGRSDKYWTGQLEPEKWLTETLSKNVDRTSCLLWPFGKNGRGYGVLTFRGAYHVLAHRSSFVQFHGPIQKGLYVLHDCDTPACVNPHHLHAGSQKQNVQEAVQRGLMPKGSAHHHAKLSEDDVRYIRSSNKTNAELCIEFEMSSGNMSIVRRGKAWRHV